MLYIASRVRHAASWIELRKDGVPISSSWINGVGPGETADLGELWSRILTEIRGSDALLFYAAASDFPLKGALVEVGVALAYGLPVFVVLEDVELDDFYRPVGSWIRHPLVRRFTSMDAALRAIAKAGRLR